MRYLISEMHYVTDIRLSNIINETFILNLLKQSYVYFESKCLKSLRIFMDPHIKITDAVWFISFNKIKTFQSFNIILANFYN